jgi:hypothetical protein
MPRCATFDENTVPPWTKGDPGRVVREDPTHPGTRRPRSLRRRFLKSSGPPTDGIFHADGKKRASVTHSSPTALR